MCSLGLIKIDYFGVFNMSAVVEYSPAIKHYLSIKEKHVDKFVFYRMGDFYELFFDDAVTAAKLFSIVLTARGKYAIPMAGVPVNSIEQYLSKAIQQNKSCVIVEQTEQVNNDGQIEREVSRIVTPGTLTDDSLLVSDKDNCFCAVYEHKDIIGVAYLSLSSGDFVVKQLEISELHGFLDKVSPQELLLPESMYIDTKYLFLRKNFTSQSVPNWHFEYQKSYKLLCQHFQVENLQCFGLDSKYNNSIIAAAIALNYGYQTQLQNLEHINTIVVETSGKYLALDHITRINLDISHNIHGEQYTLMALFNVSETAMGKRLLKKWLNYPLRDHNIINKRLEAVTILLNIYSSLKPLLAKVHDINRICARIALHTTPVADLVALRKSLTSINIFCTNLVKHPLSALLKELLDNISPNIEAIKLKLEQVIQQDPNRNIAEGGVINNEMSEELKDLRIVYKDISVCIQELEQNERISTKINTLKIGISKVHGYFIEVPKSQVSKIPTKYQEVQSLKNSIKYTYSELKSLEQNISTAKEQILYLEKQIFLELLVYLKQHIKELQELADIIAQLDVLLSFAQLAVQNNYVRPIFNDERMIEIKSSRHPIIEKHMPQFIANDISMNQQHQFMLITGANMGGKSTYMRQVAINVLLAHCGSYIAAESAIIGNIDRIFTRIGATDNLAGGQSTFMMEMVETAVILNNATANSLVILDEIGRGTSTKDGLAIAHATVRHLLEINKSLTLFATHFFELTYLAKMYTYFHNVHMKSIEHKDKIIFLYEVINGPAAKSYGIEVAKLAGLPKVVINNAYKYLNEHSSGILQKSLL